MLAREGGDIVIDGSGTKRETAENLVRKLEAANADMTHVRVITSDKSSLIIGSK